ncbi:hypothetical protein HCN44_011093 [Aphidius gifuensis]|uniref:Uncharacterized protein n=1 Tax=Aphidius gifuensis TaxID=684658 RepID=A0A835CRC9_APHGI|nr:hypothetical protein HCN44_011093 [Aphidius gifuensis]
MQLIKNSLKFSNFLISTYCSIIIFVCLISNVTITNGSSIIYDPGLLNGDYMSRRSGAVTYIGDNEKSCVPCSTVTNTVSKTILSLIIELDNIVKNHCNPDNHMKNRLFHERKNLQSFSFK